METRANYLAVGLFTLAAIVAAFVAVYFLGRFNGGEETVPLNIRIQGSVSGLGQGSNVLFNGLRVGRVTGLALAPDDPRVVIVRTQVNAATPIRSDTRANIGIQGISGGAFVQLEGGSPDASALLQQGSDGEPAVINGDPAALADLLQRVNGIAARTERIMGTLENFVNQNEKAASATFKNVETFSKALAANSDGVAKFMDSAGDVATSLENLSRKLDGTINQVEKIVGAIDPQAVKETIDGAAEFSKALSQQSTQISQLIATVNKSADQLGAFSRQLNNTLSKVDGIVDAAKPEMVAATMENLRKSTERAQELLASIDATKLGKTVDDISATAQSARSFMGGIDQTRVSTLIDDLGQASKSVSSLLAAIDAQKVNNAVESVSETAKGAQQVVDDVAKVSSKFGNRAQDIDKIVSDAAELTARLNESSKRIDDVLEQVSNLVGSGETGGIVADTRSTLAQFRRTARNLDARIAEVTRGISRFTDRGLSNTQTLINDARQSLARIDRVIRNLENNPSSLITGAGGSRVRESRSQRPRR